MITYQEKIAAYRNAIMSVLTSEDCKPERKFCTLAVLFSDLRRVENDFETKQMSDEFVRQYEEENPDESKPI